MLYHMESSYLLDCDHVSCLCLRHFGGLTNQPRGQSKERRLRSFRLSFRALSMVPRNDSTVTSPRGLGAPDYKRHQDSCFKHHETNSLCYILYRHQFTTIMTSQPNPSTVSFQSTTTVSSTTPLGPSQRPQKDYAAALSTLQSRYGTAGNIPSPKKEPSKKLPASSQPLDSVPETSAAGGSSSTSQTTLTPSSIISDASGGSSSSSTGGESRKKSKSKTSILLKSLFKGLLPSFRCLNYWSDGLRLLGKAKNDS
ncbi:hypothetical protein BDZ97DRAFT_1817317 [Flammula alnicola]|nr:hypothetical protein BDZ97DRAFT_1817317 [Flammula alnicola]